VVLDATIVNVALPHIQHALGFSGSGLEWVVNAYTLAFGSLLLLGGCAGDILGRRRVFIAGMHLCNPLNRGLCSETFHRCRPGYLSRRSRSPRRVIIDTAAE